MSAFVETSHSPSWGVDQVSDAEVLCPSLCKLRGAFTSHAESNCDRLVSAVTSVQRNFVTGDDNERRSLVSQISRAETGLLQLMLASIENFSTPTLLGSICGLLHEALSPKNSEDARQTLIQSLVMLNAAEVVLRAMKTIANDGLSKLDQCLLQTMQILAKLASRDPKLPVKIRLLGMVKLFHQLLQSAVKGNGVYILPLLILLKYTAKNSTNQVILGKDGFVTTLMNLLNSIHKSQWAKQKVILECLSLLTKTTNISPSLSATLRAEGPPRLQALLTWFFESNVVRVVRENGLLRIVSLLETWEKIEKRHQLKLLKALLSTLSHLCDSKHGRKAVCLAGGVEALHRFAVGCPSTSKFDSAMNASINVFLKCASKSDLPITSAKGPILFRSPLFGESPPSSEDFSREITPDPDHENTDEEGEGDLVLEDEDASPDAQGGGIDLCCEYNPQATRLDDLLKMSCCFPERDLHCRAASSSLDGPCPSSGKEELKPSFSESYINMSTYTKSLIEFVKVAYPDMVGGEAPPYAEPLNIKDPRVCREKALRTASRVLNAETYQEKVVYDLDFLLSSQQKLITPSIPHTKSLTNYDKKRVGRKDVSANHLNFESRFESGNLRRVIQVAPYEYDLLLNPDVNSSHYHQWFYFEVSNMQENVPYVFNIINNEKSGSEFNSGMKPVMFSVTDSLLGCPYWIRTGFDICYHKNHYVRFPKHETYKLQKSSVKSYYTATFTIKFPHANDVCYLAYHYPYTYTRMQTFLSGLESERRDPNIFYSNQILCQSLNGNALPVLTITNMPSRDSKERGQKESVFLTARVHPGESSASWMMEGALQFLLGPSSKAEALREKYVFKVVPMLNPEGVISGNQRCGLTDEDLNRRWRFPNPLLNPTIYNAKALIEYQTAVLGKKPLVFCDFHGHSNQKNVFMYGCSRQQSWWPGDRDAPDEGEFLLLPRLAQRYMDAFSLRDCHFHVDRARESTARVVVWRQFKVPMSFTMEASTCGCDQGPYKNYHLNPRSLMESGEGFCVALFHLDSPRRGVPSQHPLFNSGDGAPFSSAGAPCQDNDEDESGYSSDIDSEADLDMDLYGIR